MAEEMTKQIIALSIKAGRMSSKLLVKAMQYYSQNRSSRTIKHGQQTLEDLYRSGATLQNIEINSSNIGTFTPVANRYGIDFALKKDMNADRYLVFFKAKDVNIIDQAFKDYVAVTTRQKDTEKSRESILVKLKRYKEQIAENQKAREKAEKAKTEKAKAKNPPEKEHGIEGDALEK